MVARAPAIGIDLGTSYACVGVFQNNKVEIIPNDYGNKTTPSYVGFTATDRFIGNAAKYLEFVNVLTPSIEDTIYGAKRLIGCRFHDKFVQDQMKHWPFTVVDKAGNPHVNIQVDYMEKINPTFSLEEILAMILFKMKETAEARLGLIVTDAVISVPASFNNRQRQAIMDAAIIARLNILRIINEPTAAAIAYSLDDKINGKRDVFIFDLGGGYLDVSIVALKNSTIKVKATAGDTHLGGEDFDSCLVDHFVREIKEKHKIDITSNKFALRRLRTECEKAKRTLSSSTEAFIKIDSHIFCGIDFNSSISRDRFEELCGDLFKRITSTLEKVFQNDILDLKARIEDIVLVGGSTHIPKVQQLVKDFFRVKELNKLKFIEVDEAVAYGAAVFAAKLQGDKSDAIQHLHVLDVASFSLHIEMPEEKTDVVVHPNSSIPTEKTPYVCVCTTSLDNQASIAIKVYEDDHTNKNLLGKFVIMGIPPARRGVPHIEIRLAVDSNGILTISAVERSSGCDKNLSISSETGRPSWKEIERMINNAQRYRSKDEKERERIAIKNTFETSYSNFRNELQDETSKDKFSDADKKILMGKCNELHNWQQNYQSKGILPSKEEFQHKLNDLECFMKCIPIYDIESKKEKKRVAALNSLKSLCSQINGLVDSNISAADREKNVMKKRDDITSWLTTNPSADNEEIELERKDLELTLIQHWMADFTKLVARREELNKLPESEYTRGYKAFRCVIAEKIKYFMNKQNVPDRSLGHTISLKLLSLLDDTEGSQNTPLYGAPFKLDPDSWSNMISCIMKKSNPKWEYINKQNSDLTDLDKLKGIGLAAAEVIEKILYPDQAQNVFHGFLQSLDSRLKTLDFSLKSEEGSIEQKQHSDEIKKIGTVFIASFEYKLTCHSSCNVGSNNSQLELAVHSKVWEFSTISEMKCEYLQLTQE